LISINSRSSALQLGHGFAAAWNSSCNALIYLDQLSALQLVVMSSGSINSSCNALIYLNQPSALQRIVMSSRLMNFSCNALIYLDQSSALQRVFMNSGLRNPSCNALLRITNAVGMIPLQRAIQNTPIRPCGSTRRGRQLSPEDNAHYPKVVVALNETICVMAEIDAAIEAHGGWLIQ